jgi:hypothetical protein
VDSSPEVLPVKLPKLKYDPALELPRRFGPYRTSGCEIARLTNRTEWLDGTILTMFGEYCVMRSRATCPFHYDLISATLMADIEYFLAAWQRQEWKAASAVVLTIAATLDFVSINVTYFHYYTNSCYRSPGTITFVEGPMAHTDSRTTALDTHRDSFRHTSHTILR